MTDKKKRREDFTRKKRKKREKKSLSAALLDQDVRYSLVGIVCAYYMHV